MKETTTGESCKYDLKNCSRPMTPQPAQQEYFLITKDELTRISEIDYGNCDAANRVVAKVRSRPAPAPAHSTSLTAIEIALRKEENPSENVQWAIEKLNRYQENQEHHDTAVASQAREKVLAKLVEKWSGRYVEDAIAEIRRFPHLLDEEAQR
jgi:hypothetical protein